jgi:uncharacterized membrane protein
MASLSTLLPTQVLPTNVTPAERLLTGAAAGALLLVAARRPAARAPLGALSGALLLRALSGYCPVYHGVGVEATAATKARLGGPRGAHIRTQTTIAQPVESVYAFWRNLEHLSRALPDFIEVRMLDHRRSHWTVRSPESGVPLAEWTAELINDVPEKLLAWQTTADAGVVNAGSVNFAPAPGGQGTEVRIHLQYSPPLGRLGAGLAALAGQRPSRIATQALASVKRYLEIGRPVVLAR